MTGFSIANYGNIPHTITATPNGVMAKNSGGAVVKPVMTMATSDVFTSSATQNFGTYKPFFVQEPTGTRLPDDIVLPGDWYGAYVLTKIVPNMKWDDSTQSYINAPGFTTIHTTGKGWKPIIPDTEGRLDFGQIQFAQSTIWRETKIIEGPTEYNEITYIGERVSWRTKYTGRDGEFLEKKVVEEYRGNVPVLLNEGKWVKVPRFFGEFFGNGQATINDTTGIHNDVQGDAKKFKHEVPLTSEFDEIPQSRSSNADRATLSEMNGSIRSIGAALRDFFRNTLGIENSFAFIFGSGGLLSLESGSLSIRQSQSVKQVLENVNRYHTAVEAGDNVKNMLSGELTGIAEQLLVLKGLQDKIHDKSLLPKEGVWFAF